MDVEVDVEVEVRPSSEAGNSLLMATISKNTFECTVGTDLLFQQS